MNHHINLVLTAVEGTLSGVVGLFFVRFWRQTHDRFFMFFALAFGALAVNWLVLAIGNLPDEARTSLFVLRLCAFLLIIAGIVDKNLSVRGSRR